MGAAVGFIGLGTMGAPMAGNLVRGGFDVVVYDVSAPAVERLCRAGARRAASPREAATLADTVVTMLPSESALRAVVLDDDGLLAGLRRGAVLIDMSTVEPATSRELAARLRQIGAAMLDAPVSRGHQAAIAGTLSIMVGGERAVYERSLGLLRTLGTDVFHCGPNGMGALFKLVNNAIVATTACAIAEALVMGVKAGADLAALLPVLRASSSNGFVLEHFFANKALRGDFEPGGSIDIVAKDLELALRVAGDEQVPMPLGAASYQQYAVLRGQGDGGRDFTAVLTLAEQAAGVQARLAQQTEAE
ncbi:MAG: NAD(P)-dependent oxidoreductase [Burkholderiaceae bacterium]